MADNFLRTPGSGESVAGDEVTDATLGTVKVQFVKLMDGTLDGTSKAAVGANGLAVDVKALPAVSIAASQSVGLDDTQAVPIFVQPGVVALAHYSNEFTTTQTGATLVTGQSGKKVYVCRLAIGTGGTTAGLCTVWFGQSADTTYTAATDITVFRGNFAPNTASYPGVVIGDGKPFCVSNAYDYLRLTTSAAMTVYVQVDYFIA